MPEKCIGILGATSLVGHCLLRNLAKTELSAVAFSRGALKHNAAGVRWRSLNQETVSYTAVDPIANWICVAPIWVVEQHFQLLEAYGARRVITLSSTSALTKSASSDPEEQAVALRLVSAEAAFQSWAQSRDVDWVILRPTLIYGLGQDKNISEIARIIRRFGLFPFFGKANGLRQPVHAADVADACLSALLAPGAANSAYNISGGETLSYREMVVRVFAALGRRPRVLTVPLWAFRLAVTMLRCLPRYRQWSAAMAERMNRDLVFDHTEAVRDLGFKPRDFVLTAEDLPL